MDRPQAVLRHRSTAPRPSRTNHIAVVGPFTPLPGTSRTSVSSAAGRCRPAPRDNRPLDSGWFELCVPALGDLAVRRAQVIGQVHQKAASGACFVAHHVADFCQTFQAGWRDASR